jgi:predicted permease
MNWLRELVRRIQMLIHRENFDAELNEEMRLHVDLRTQQQVEMGAIRREAADAARRRFGNVTALTERSRGAWRWEWLDDLAHDLRYGARALRKSPGVSAIAVMTIALGIGATTAIFSVVDATLLHPLPFPHPEQLVRVEADFPGIGSTDVGFSQPEWLDLQHSGIFENVSPTWYDDNNLTGASRPTRVSLMIVAPNYFDILGVKPEAGRTFPAEDRSPGILPEAVISDGMWKRLFGGDPGILGKGVRLDTDLYQVVGVMPSGFQVPGRSSQERSAEVWVPTSFYGAPLLDQPPRNGRNLPTAIARLKTGLTIAQAQSQVDALVASLKKQFPADYPAQGEWTIRLIPLQQSVVGNVRTSLILLLGAVGLVLLIGCVNIANLLLARASARGREMAVRQALGAARFRLIRQLLTESVLLSFVGGIVGLVILFALKGALLRALPATLPRLNEISINWGVLLFALVASVTAGVIFGLAPALQAGRVDLIHALKQEGRGSTGSGEQARTRRALVVTELALSLVLMICAGLLLRSFWDLLNAHLGFNPESVITVRTRLPYPNNASLDVYHTNQQMGRFFREVLQRVRNLPGVEEAAFGDLAAIPLAHDRNNQNPPDPLVIEGREHDLSQAPLVDDCFVTPEYFHVMGMTLLRGRLFTAFDDENAPPVAVINEAMARTYWPHENPIGQHVRLTLKKSQPMTIVGIVANARAESLENAQIPELYVNLYERGTKHLAIFLRGHMDAGAIEGQVRQQVQIVDPTIPVFRAETLNQTVSASLAERRFSMEMIALFALTALLLAAIGIYGVISYMVSERTHEIGIRVALGARSQNILGMVLRQGLSLAIVGAGIGLIGALVVSRLMASLLYTVRPTDPLTFSGVAILLIGVALVACYVPARRAMNVDPIVALRHE